jgi:DNA-binding response OmpR family regulator
MHDVESFRFILKNEIIDLTIPENIILNLLLENKGNLVKYSELIYAVYKKQDDDMHRKCINSHICRLNKKLKHELNIKNRIRIGYILM